MEPSDARAEVIRGYEASADQLEMAARHLRVAAKHYQDGEVAARGERGSTCFPILNRDVRRA